MNNGFIYWNEFNVKAPISKFKIDEKRKTILIETKETNDFTGFSIVLNSEDNFNFTGRYDCSPSEVFTDSIKGNLYMKYYKNNNNHVLFGKWMEEGETFLCVIQVSE